MKKLKLRRETIVNLTNRDLANVQGGNTIIIVIRTRACPVLSNGCTAGCQETIGGTGGPVIIPG